MSLEARNGQPSCGCGRIGWEANNIVRPAAASSSALIRDVTKEITVRGVREAVSSLHDTMLLSSRERGRHGGKAQHHKHVGNTDARRRQGKGRREKDVPREIPSE